MATVVRRGRPPASSRESIAATAVELFFQHGYGNTTIARIASVAGISETSFFRYFTTKAETVWADFDAHTHRLRQRLGSEARPTGDLERLREAVVETFRADLDTGGLSLRKFELFDTSPDLRAEEAVHWVTWTNTVASYLDGTTAEPTPGAAAVAAAVQATALTALRLAVRHPTPPDAILAALDEQLQLVCATMRPLLLPDGRASCTAQGGWFTCDDSRSLPAA